MGTVHSSSLEGSQVEIACSLGRKKSITCLCRLKGRWFEEREGA